jgi:hypothetical protein
MEILRSLSTNYVGLLIFRLFELIRTINLRERETEMAKAAVKAKAKKKPMAKKPAAKKRTAKRGRR